MKATFQNFLLLSCFIFIVLPSIAQVKNDNIEQRLVMISDSVYQSTTIGCTIQKNCIDQKRYANCVEFHNDQWFEFTPQVSGRFYVNMATQQCRDVRGVQLLVLTGEPCQPETQEVIHCTSLGNQDDVFVQLDSLKAGTRYLLNLDGYLHDYCSFTIEISQKPKGLPTVLPSAKQMKVAENKVVKLTWEIPDSDLIRQFRILRREAKQGKSVALALLPVSRDSYGNPVKAYSFTDTLTLPGNYNYLVVTQHTEADESPEILLREWHKLEKHAERSYITLPLDKYPNGAEIQVVVLDYQTGKLVKQYQIKKSKKTLYEDRFYYSEFQSAGLKKLRVQISYSPSRKNRLTDEIIIEIPEK